jgi:hypothetical protein
MFVACMFVSPGVIRVFCSVCDAWLYVWADLAAHRSRRCRKGFERMAVGEG